MSSKSSDKGNILFLILLAVMLFAALSYAVTSSVRGGGKNASEENISLFIDQVIQAANLLENNMIRAMLVDGVPEYGFDLSGTNSNSTTNETCTSNNCKMLAGNGGSVHIPKIPANLRLATSSTYKKFYFWMIRMENVGTSADDLVMVGRYVTEEVCQAFNKKLLGHELSLVSDSYDGSSTSDIAYSGILSALPSGGARYGNDRDQYAGKKALCLMNNGGPPSQYIILYVLMER